MIIRDIAVEDFVNYKKSSMFISMGFCDWKCCKEQNLDISICQNSSLAKVKERELDNNYIIDLYIENPITESIVIGGLEPFTRFDSLIRFIEDFRKVSSDDIVIYTGYTRYELEDELKELSKFVNIIVKYGRFVPNEIPHYDDVLGVNLSSNNQYAVKLPYSLKDV